jgi:hypothetical protein
MARADTPLVNETVQFWRDIRDISDSVLALTKSPPSVLSETHDHLALLLQNRGLAVDSMRERLLRNTAQLINFQSAFPGVTNDEFVAWLVATARACLSERASSNNPVPVSLANLELEYSETKASANLAARGNEVLMEGLTAAWLGLYFLGIPFIHPWDRVRRLAEDCGGFPSGACVTKYIGDLYRHLRQRMVRDLVGYNERNDGQALVLSYAPSVLLKHLLERDEENITPPSLHVLGRCYALLQLRLYIGEGFPVTYFVSEQILRNYPRQLGTQNADHIEDMRIWLNTNFRAPVKGQSVLLLKPDFFPVGIPTCVLGSRAGIYVLNTNQHPVPFAGNLLRESLLKSYREKLNRLKERGIQNGGAGSANVTELLGRDKNSFAEVFRHL